MVGASDSCSELALCALSSMFIEKVEPPGTVLEKAELASTVEESLNQC